jgi:hypothetical protein
MRLAALLLALMLTANPFLGSSKSTSSVSHRASSTKTYSTHSTRTKAAKPAKVPKAPKVAKASKAPKVTKARRPSGYCASCERDSRGRIMRSESATQTFRHLNPCPATGKSSGGCPGYVIDHVVPLKRGGPDAPSNMQWQTKAEAKAKDRVE